MFINTSTSFSQYCWISSYLLSNQKLLWTLFPVISEFFDDSHLTELSEINDSLSIPIPLIKPPVVVQKPKIRYYRVKSGDTLTEIADRNNTTVTKLCQLNGIKPTSIIQLGKSLRIK